MLAFQAGSEEAFVKLYRLYRDRIFNFARRMLGDQAQAEEAAQDVFLKIYRAKDRYRANSKFSTYIFRVASNHCLNLLARKEHRLTDHGEMADHPSNNDDPESSASRSQLRSIIAEAVRDLPSKQAAALLLCLHEGMTYRDVAEALDTSESAIKSLVFRARETMMKKLSTQLPGAEEVAHAVQ